MRAGSRRWAAPAGVWAIRAARPQSGIETSRPQSSQADSLGAPDEDEEEEKEAEGDTEKETEKDSREEFQDAADDAVGRRLGQWLSLGVVLGVVHPDAPEATLERGERDGTAPAGLQAPHRD